VCVCVCGLISACVVYVYVYVCVCVCDICKSFEFRKGHVHQRIYEKRDIYMCIVVCRCIYVDLLGLGFRV